MLTPGGLLVQWDWELDPTQDEPFGLSRDQIAHALNGAGLVGVAVDIGFKLPFEGYTMAPLRGIGQRA
ncbi:MAG: hypothetical protein AB8H79_00450 [Myxococcota bacterium]